MTSQEFLTEVNINSILGRYARTGVLKGSGLGSGRQPQFGDFTSELTYHDQLNRVTQADSDFKALPSDLRNYFDNDPGKLIDFVQDPENREEAEGLGLIPKTEKKIESTTPTVNPTPPAAEKTSKKDE